MRAETSGFIEHHVCLQERLCLKNITIVLEMRKEQCVEAAVSPSFPVSSVQCIFCSFLLSGF